MKKIFYPFLALTVAVMSACSTFQGEKPADKSIKKEFTFYNIFIFSAGSEKQTARAMIEYQQRTGNQIVLYSLNIQPEGFPAKKKADIMISSYRRLKKELTGSDVQLGVLLQSVLGHRPRAADREEKWTKAVNIDGNTTRFCSFDPEFRKYILYTVSELAKEKPVFIMGDDDIRSFSPKAECFCHRHVAEFNRRSGKSFTSETLREAVKNCKPGDEIFRTFHRLQRDTVNGTAALIRRAIDSVDPAIPAGSCMSGWEFRFNDQTARAFAAAGQPPVMRVCNANYNEQSAKKEFPELLIRTMALREAHSDIPHVLDEADTYPHSLYSRAAVSMHAKLCAAVIAGYSGAKIWYVNARKNFGPVPRQYTDILAKHRNYYQVLSREVKNSEFTGLIQPLHRNFPKWHFTDATTEFFVDRGNWADTMCAVFGIPFYCSAELNKDGIYLLAGADAVKRFSDAELRQLLSGKLLVDGTAAAALTERGFAEYLGVSAERKKFRYNREYHTGGGSLTMINNRNVPYLKLNSKNTEVLTSFFYSSFSDPGKLTKVSPATVFFKNSLGGHICTTSTYMSSFNLPLHNQGRKKWLLTVLEKLNGKPLPFVVENDQNYAALTRISKDGSTLFAACNLNFEPVENFTFRCAEKPEKILLLAPDGSWKKTDFKWQNGTAVTSHRMDCYTFSVFKIR